MPDFPFSPETETLLALAKDCELYAKVIEGIIVVDDETCANERREPKTTLLKAAAILRGHTQTPNELLMWAAGVAEKGAKQCSDGDSEWHRGFRYAADNTAKGIAADLRRAALADTSTLLKSKESGS